MADIKATAIQVNKVFHEIYSERYPGFDASRLRFSGGYWSYETSHGVVLRIKGVGLEEAASSNDCYAEVAKVDGLLRQAYNLELGGPTGFMWVGWR